MRRSALLALLAAALPAPAAADYKAGAAKVDITPTHPVRLNGFGGRRAESEGVYQKVYARALALHDGTAPAVLLAVDVLGMPADLYDALAARLAKSAGLAKDRLAVATTHTHTGPMLKGANPTLFGVPIPPEHQANIDRYTPVFLDKLEQAALAALKDLKPARLEWGVGTATFAVNRRAGGGPVDHDLPVLLVRDPNGGVRAVYAAYACHAVTLSLNQLGGDWPGFAAAAVEDDHPGAVALVGIGCGADQNPRSGVTGGNVEVARVQGREIAAEVRRLAGMKLAPIAAALTARTTTLDLPLADLPTRAQWEEKAKRGDAVGHHARVNLARLDRGEKLPTTVPYPVQTWAFGDALAMAHLPGEVVVDYSKRLKAELDAHRLWATAYANNAPCYIPSERVLKEGGYEGGDAMIYYDLPVRFEPGLEGAIVGAVTKQLGDPFKAKVDPAKTGGSRSLTPPQSHGRIRVGPGLAVDLVAAEPLVADPVAVAFGPDGKVWVAEMADYPTGKTDEQYNPGGRVVFLEDRDRDGTLDTRTVFLDNLPFPTGLLPWRTGVLVCAAPDILYAEDTTGDGKADVTTKLFSGFGTQNYQARVNSLQYGLDGWVYGSCGLFGGTITSLKTGAKHALGDRDFRIKPDTGELQPATGRTQQGRVRDDAGNWFGCDNSNVLWHHVLADHYLPRNPAATYPPGTKTLVGGTPLFGAAGAQRWALSGAPNTVTAACGVGVYRDDLLGPAFTGNTFTCEPVNLLVHRRVLTPEGATFRAERARDELEREFLTSTDPWFRPVHATTGPDGGLWVADMYRFLIEHPKFLPPADRAKIDVRAGAGMGRLYRVRPDGAPLRPWVRVRGLTAARLVAALDTPNGVQRDAAMMELIWTADPTAVAPLEELLAKGPRPLARLHALAALDALGKLTPAALVGALADADPVVRRHAVRAAAEAKLAHFAVFATVTKLATDADVPVRVQVAYSLGASAGAAAGKTLARLALDAKGDPYLTAAVASSLTATNLPVFAAEVFAAAGPEGPPAPLVRDLFATAPAADNGAALPGLLDALMRTTPPRAWQLAAAAATLDTLERRGQPWAKLPEPTRAALAPLVAAARKSADAPTAAEGDLLAALPLLGRDPTTRRDDLTLLAAQLSAVRPAAVQAAALTALARVPDDAVPARLAEAWPGASPALRGRILDALLSRPAWAAPLLDAVEKGTIAPGLIDAGRRQRLTTHADAAVRARAAARFAGATDADRAKVVEAARPALAMTGDRTRGKAVFAKACSACHVLDGVGSPVGPDLAALANKTPLYLLTEILDPNRNVDSRYVEYRAETADGRSVSGLLAAETATAVTLRGQQNKEDVIPRADIVSLRGTAKSLMPEGLEKDLPHQDLSDLLAYLTTADAPPKRMAGNTPSEVAVQNRAAALPASKAFVYGGPIVFEPEFSNLGYWHGEHDRAVWHVRVPAAAAFDVYLDYSCANDTAGNAFAVDGGEPTLTGKVAGTGGFDRYRLVKVGTVKLGAGVVRVTVRPDGPVRGALFDLRTVHLVPPGQTPAAKAEAPADQLRALVADLKAGDAAEEYRRIPRVFTVTLAAGKANDAAALRGVLDAALPKVGEPLRDWQAVALGGGVVNGLSQVNVWPAARVAALVKDDAALAARWAAVLPAAHAMADDVKVPTGTRYDALRLVALDSWDKAGPRLTKYLAKSAHPELQQGTVSGLSHVDRAEVGPLLSKALPDLTAGNRALAVAALLRTPARMEVLAGALEARTADAAWLSPAQAAALKAHPDAAVRARAERALGR